MEWEKYWNETSSLKSQDLQKQVGRTVLGKAISEELWSKTLDVLKDNLGIDKHSILLDLCCGNGALSIPFSAICLSIKSIDFSKHLTQTLKENSSTNNIDVICGNILSVDYGFGYSHAILYFSLQYFNEKETITILKKVYGVLKSGGVFYIGDIPDRMRLWHFANTKEFETQYFRSIEEDNPKIGNWFIKEDLMKMAEFCGFKEVHVIEQQEWMYNSHYRFDIIMKK
ncbi:MAG: class I SAM-dependent methyltransferase [Bacteroidales bacterium]|nr:class I SAM-dependent methyltransferase [Bacteroidales bacterium]